MLSRAPMNSTLLRAPTRKQNPKANTCEHTLLFPVSENSETGRGRHSVGNTFLIFFLQAWLPPSWLASSRIPGAEEGRPSPSTGTPVPDSPLAFLKSSALLSFPGQRACFRRTGLCGQECRRAVESCPGVLQGDHALRSDGLRGEAAG